jgi:hypothetical protein
MNIQTTSRTKNAFGRGCGALFFSIFALFGGFFAVMLGGALMKDFQTRSWVPVEAVLTGRPSGLEKLELERSSNSSEERVPYRYSYEGRTYNGDRVTRESSMKVNGRTSDSGQRLSRMPAGTKVTCFVNPANPDEAVLERRSLSYAWFMLLPGIFLVIGLGGVFFSLFGKSAADKPASERHRPKSNKAGTLGARLFGMVFMAVGLVATWFISIAPSLRAREARAWTEVPCRIEEASVKSSRGSKGGTNYRIHVVYTYEVGGQRFTGDRYNFSTGSSSSRDWREKAVDELRANPSPVCFVNPDDPLDSVIMPEVGGERWIGLLTMVFFFVGLGIFMAAPKMAARSRNRTGLPNPVPAQKPVVSLAHGGYELKPGVTPKAGCIGMGCVAIFWNGIVWAVFLQPDTPTVARLFLLIFVLIGLGIGGGFGYYFLSMFNPKATLVADAQDVPLGGALKLKWKFEGNTSRISQLTVSLVAKESATYRRGTNTTTDHQIFVNEQLCQLRDRALIAAGEIAVNIPSNSMHSFDAPNNKIVWAIKVHGDIAKWPDVDLEFPITVLPATGSGPQTQPDSAV